REIILLFVRTRGRCRTLQDFRDLDDWAFRGLEARSLRDAELEDVAQYLRDGDVQARGDLGADVDIAIEDARERRRLENRDVVLRAHFANTSRDEIGAFRDDDWRTHALLVIAQRDGEVSRVRHDHVRIRHVLHHALARHLLLDLTDAPFDLRRALALLHLLADFLAAH